VQDSILRGVAETDARAIQLPVLTGGFVRRAEHRGALLEGELLNMRYYGGAEGNVLVYHPALGLTSVLRQRDDKHNVGEEYSQQRDENGNGDGEGVTINLPPPGTLPFSAVYSRFISFEISFNLKNPVFWEVAPCGSCKDRRFGGT
jgi:hypothetical protein